MRNRLSRWGVGPKIAASTAVYAALAGIATYLWPDACLLRSIPHGVVRVVGALLLLAGVSMWLVAVVTVMRAYNSDRLVTSGVFALCRHPVYSAWIVLNTPGLALLSRSWPLMLTPLVAYAVFKRLVNKEDVYLEQRFGPAYLEYRGRVREIIPIPKLGRGTGKAGAKGEPS